jgi:hypothetical protein
MELEQVPSLPLVSNWSTCSSNSSSSSSLNASSPISGDDSGGGKKGLESLDCTFLDVPDALLDFGLMFSSPPLPSYCGSPWDDIADDFCFQEPWLLWEY